MQKLSRKFHLISFKLGKIEGRRRRGRQRMRWLDGITNWWTWVWVNSGSWWWTGRPGVLRFMGSQRVGHDWATEQRRQWHPTPVLLPGKSHGWEPGRLQSMGSLRVGHDWVTSLSLFTFLHWRRKWQPTPVFLPGESQGRGSPVAAVYGVAQSRTRLKRLSSSSSRATELKA